ncbi:MAG: FAD-dependent oxidoreductase, partial [Erysipelotrichaceae bacterium]|nr:FAD-dependent oxidoreductase [Erysipelotrichaceae bacterium]
PVFSVGLFHDPYTIETAIKRGDCDAVSLGRQSIADPAFPNKVVGGAEDDIIPCIGCTQRCMEFNYPENLMPGDWGVGCMYNPQSSHRADRMLTQTAEPKNVVVVGAGPGGMTAAWMSAFRGHNVTLIEKEDKLHAGGQLRIGAFPPFKQPLTREIRYMLRQCEKNGVNMMWNTEATPELIKGLNPDVVIMATGATPLVPNIPGLKETGVVLANDVLQGTPVLKQSCLIIGGGEVGAETAEFATDYCSRVAIVEMLPEIVPTLYLTVRNAMLQRIKEEEVEVHTNTKVLEFVPGGAKVECNGEQFVLDGFDTVILALGSRPHVPFDAEGLAKEVYTIGDAEAVKDAKWAIYKAYTVAKNL